MPVRVWPGTNQGNVYKQKKRKLSNCIIRDYLFLIRWHQTFFVLDENIDSKIIFESITDGYKYFPIFKAFTELSLNISYDNDIINLKNLSAPAGSFYLHSILYLLIRSWSFIILELVFIIIFLGIFYKISRLLDFRRIESFLISIFLYNLTTF